MGEGAVKPQLSAGGCIVFLLQKVTQSPPKAPFLGNRVALDFISYDEAMLEWAGPLLP